MKVLQCGHRDIHLIGML
jgi:hypothetical protein